MWKRLPLLLLLAAFAPAAQPPAQPEVVRFGAVELAYDPARFTVERVDWGLWRARPVDEHEGQTLNIRTDYGGPCSQEAMAALAETSVEHGGHGATTLPSGLILHAAQGGTGCRNATVGVYAACVRHGPATVLFQTPPNGCDDSPYGDDPPQTLLQGLRPYRPVPPPA